MEELNLQELCQRTIVISKITETIPTWGNGPLTTITDKGLSVFDFSSNLSLWNKMIDLSESAIPSPNTSPASKLLKIATKGPVMSNLNVSQMIIDPVFWPHNKELTNELAAVTSHEYSPPKFTFNNNLFLATLTNIGTVNIFSRQKLSWDNVFDLSAFLEESLDVKYGFDLIDNPNKLDMLRQACSALQSCAICWGPYDSTNSFCYFVTAQRNSDVLIWKLEKDNDSLKAMLLTKLAIDTSEIVSIHWIPQSKQTFLLTYSNILGQLSTLECSIVKENVSIINKNTLWKHQDRMIVKILRHRVIADNKIQCIYAKHRHLIIQMLNNNGEVLSECHSNINDNKITCIFQFKGDLYLCTENVCVFKILITTCDKNVSVQVVPIFFKDSYAMHNLYGIAVSNNEVIWALVMISRKISSRKEPQCIKIVFLTPTHERDAELEKLVNNPTNKLTGMWDCIELQRYKSLKTKSLPALDYNKMFVEAQTEPYKLKLYKIFLELQINLKSTCSLKRASEDLLPETSMEKVKETLLFQHALGLVQKLLCKYKNNDLEPLDEESFAYTKLFLGFYCQKYKCELTEMLTKEVLQNKMKPVCDFCEEELEGFRCKDGHINMFCSLTFTPINSFQYLSCHRCKATARIELSTVQPTCIFCDLYLVRS